MCRQVVGRHALYSGQGTDKEGAGSYALTQGLRHIIFAVDFKPFQHGIFQIWSIHEAWLEAPHLKMC